MPKKQPSLRNFAIIARTFRSKVGSLWEVKDRRSPDASQYLFTPSVLMSWPRWVAILGDSCSPIKLRNGKVALLLSRDLDFEQIAKRLKYSRGRNNYRLQPMIGFAEDKNRRFKFALPLTIVLVLTAGLLTITLSSKAVVIATAKQSQRSVQQKSCGEIELLGAILPTNIKAHTTLSFQENKFRIMKTSSFGGLTQIQVRRICDGKRFRLEAWRAKDSLLVSKVS
ncbi:MAG: hypothetical protein WCK24_03115 [Actinomycetes bacterium]